MIEKKLGKNYVSFVRFFYGKSKCSRVVASVAPTVNSNRTLTVKVTCSVVECVTSDLKQFIATYYGFHIIIELNARGNIKRRLYKLISIKRTIIADLFPNRVTHSTAAGGTTASH